MAMFTLWSLCFHPEEIWRSQCRFKPLQQYSGKELNFGAAINFTFSVPQPFPETHLFPKLPAMILIPGPPTQTQEWVFNKKWSRDTGLNQFVSCLGMGVFHNNHGVYVTPFLPRGLKQKWCVLRTCRVSWRRIRARRAAAG